MTSTLANLMQADMTQSLSGTNMESTEASTIRRAYGMNMVLMEVIIVNTVPSIIMHLILQSCETRMVSSMDISHATSINQNEPITNSLISFVITTRRFGRT